MDFIFVSLQRINTDRESTSTSLAKQLAKNHNVLYVNPPVDRKSWLYGSDDEFVTRHIAGIKNKGVGLVKMEDGLTVLTPKNIIESINWIPFTSMFSVANKLNNMTFSKEILRAIKRLGFSNYILINDKDMFRSFYLKELLAPKLSIYLYRDYTLGFEYWKRHGEKLEPELIKKSDLIVTNSLDFQKIARQYNEASFYIGNGANIQIFSHTLVHALPIELANLKTPIIGYVGALISSRLDISLLISIANKFKDSSLVLIGPEDDDFRKSELHKLPNVIFLGKISTELIPAYVKSFDVCINPQLINEITIGNFPLKIVEYLAMGKAIVATATNTMKEVFSNHTYLADSPEAFIKLIQVALSENDDLRTRNPRLQLERIDYANKFSWENVTANLLAAICDVSSGK